MRLRNAALLLVLLFVGAAHTPPAGDPLSDMVGATKGTFEVSASGAATYSIPIYTTPGAGGLVPKLSLDYNSQGGDGPLGRGWSLAGTSAISRCRSARETGDFTGNEQPQVGGPGRLAMNSNDRFCLDGQRLLRVTAAELATSPNCKALAGANAIEYRTEIESFQRVCAYEFSADLGPRFFTAEHKDGSTSWYGDRRETTGDATATRIDAVVNYVGYSSGPPYVYGPTDKYLTWAQTRHQDPAGNYIDYQYLNHLGELYLTYAMWNGKNPVNGGPSWQPNASVMFTWNIMPESYSTESYFLGMAIPRVFSLESIKVTDSGNEVRYYVLRYNGAGYGGTTYNLQSVTECADSTSVPPICYPATAFTWSNRDYQFAPKETLTVPSFDKLGQFHGYKMGDIDGDGLQDIVRLKDGGSGDDCDNEYVIVEYGAVDANGKPTYVEPQQETSTTLTCTPRELKKALGDDSWFVFDYDGDGRDDLFMAGDYGNSNAAKRNYLLYASNGRPTSGRMFGTTNLIGSLVPAPESKKSVAQLGDLNGDGLLDVIYKSGTSYYARLMESNGTNYGWGSARVLTFAQACGGTPEMESTEVTKANGGYQLYDFNGDSRSDLIFRVKYATATSYCAGVAGYYMGAYTVQSISAGTIALSQYTWIYESEDNDVSDGPTYAQSFRFADFNGDGLTDMLYRADAYDALNGNWVFQVNTGRGFTGKKVLKAYQTGPDAYTMPDQDLQVFDLNGDGQADLVWADYGAIYVHYGLSTGANFSEKSWVWASEALVDCTAYLCHRQYSHVFTDVDGDGGLDFLRIKWKDSNNNDDFGMAVFRSLPDKRYVPSNTITAITDGLGAKTELTYLPLTLKDVYRRDSNSRNLMTVGRGSAVQDLFAPMYVVATARTDSPTEADPSAQRAVHYRYSGAKMQAGGRGFLGFEQVTSIDTADAASPVATTTTFQQDFPYIGKPMSTDVTVLGAPYVPGACATAANVFPASCFSYQTGSFPALPGTLVSRTNYSWQSNYSAATQAPVRVELRGTESESFDLETGTRLARVSTAFEYDAWSNPTLSTVGTYPGAETPGPNDPAPRIKTTTSAYENVEATWRLGRMLTSRVDHTRDGVTVTRNTAFAYDAATGLLVREHLQPEGAVTQDLRTEYTLDAYGNRTGAYTCSKDIATCITTTPVVGVWAVNTIHRYTKQSYDARGRFPVATTEPFADPASTWGTGARKDAVTQQVVSRDRFGNATEVTGLNGALSTASFGMMGRPYWTWSRTVVGAAAGSDAGGVDSKHTYRRCGTGANEVPCPTAATFREKVKADGAPTKWVYFDRLGRSVLAVQETLNAGVLDQDLSAVCTWYDGSGRVSAVSNPFFLPGAFGGNDPTFATPPCLVTTLEKSVGVTRSFFDVLGRPTATSTVGRDAGGALVYANDSVVDYQGLATVTTNDLGQTKTEVRNPAGELVSSTDNLGTATRYEYDPTGNLTKVRRNAGRGDIVTSISYDALGRKTSMIDPDAGTRSYAYNPAGEPVGESNSTTYLGKRYDFKGRLIWSGEKRLVDTDYEQVTTRTYDTADSGNGTGLLASTATTGRYVSWSLAPSFDIDISAGYSYDALGRPIATATKIPVHQAAALAEATQYDALGRPYKQQDATASWAKTEFSARGFPLRVCLSTTADATPGCVPTSGNTYRDTLATDARGNPVKQRLGGVAAMMSTRKYHPFSGALLEICTGTNVAATDCQIVDEKYAWDDTGNLLSRDKNFQGVAKGYLEEFTYDGLNRLKESRFARIGARGAGAAYAGDLRPYGAQLTYDAFGSICSRLTPSTGTPTTRTYAYAGASGCGLGGLPGSGAANTAASPGAVASVSLGGSVETNYAYDITGNQTSADRVADTNDRYVFYTQAGQAHEIHRGKRETRFFYDGNGGRYMRDDVDYTPATPATTRTVTVGNVEFVSGAVNYTRRYVAGVMYQQLVGTTPQFNRYLHTDHLGNVVTVTGGNGVVVERLDYSPSGERRSTTDPRLVAITSTQTQRGFTGHEMVDYLDVVHMNGRIYDPALGRFLQVDPVIQDPTNGQNYNRYTYVWNNPLAYTDPTGMISVKQLIRNVAAVFVSAWIGNRGAEGGSNGALATTLGSLFSSYVSGGKSGIGLAAAFSTATTDSHSSVESNESEGVVSTEQDSEFADSAEETYSFKISNDKGDWRNHPLSISRKVSIATRKRIADAYLQTVWPKMSARSFKSEDEAARAFRQAFAPMAGYLGLEFGAAIEEVAKGSDYRLIDAERSTLFDRETEHGVNVIGAGWFLNPDVTAWIHIHPEINYPWRQFSWDDIQTIAGTYRNAYLFYPEGFGRKIDYTAWIKSGTSREQLYYGQDKLAPEFR